MTLVLNEIHTVEGFNRSFIIAAADRRLSNQDGSYHATRKKLFSIPYLNGAISYFGLAMFYNKNKPFYVSDYLKSFIQNNSKQTDLKSFASELCSELNKLVPRNILKNNPSGFHLCGYNNEGLPDFWYFSNIGGMHNLKYINLRDQYETPKSHFLDRDASSSFNWDGKNPLSVKNGVQTYRNGDFRAHVASWESVDGIYSTLLNFPDFKHPRTPEEYGEYVKFKFEFIAYIYKKWASMQIIARPIDVIVLKNT